MSLPQKGGKLEWYRGVEPSPLNEAEVFYSLRNTRIRGCGPKKFEEEYEMENRYDFINIEKKWRAEWEKNPINLEDDKKPKFTAWICSRILPVQACTLGIGGAMC